MSAWTPERVAKLKVLWLQGLSCSQIAKKLGGVTRNAVVGKRVRMGLPDRSPEKGYNRGSCRTTSSSGNRCFVHAAKPSQIGPCSIPFINRKRNQCAMFCEGEEGALGFVCGAPTDGISSWCKSCRSRVFAPVRKMEAA